MLLERILFGKTEFSLAKFSGITDSESFHGVYWPAFLMALDLPLPRQILAHAHWTLGERKMSKTGGNVVNPFHAIERFGVDTVRYFLAVKGGIKDDAAYDNDFITTRYNEDLKQMLGNLVTRVVRGQGWNVRRAVQTNEFPESPSAHKHLNMIKELPFAVREQIEKHLDVGSALEKVMQTGRMVCFLEVPGNVKKSC
jgi:methionyl-tRNA synthetase